MGNMKLWDLTKDLRGDRPCPRRKVYIMAVSYVCLKLFYVVDSYNTVLYRFLEYSVIAFGILLVYLRTGSSVLQSK